MLMVLLAQLFLTRNRAGSLLLLSRKEVLQKLWAEKNLIPGISAET
jgi:hypothetical protein